MDTKSIVDDILDAAIAVHRALGRGLFEHTYRDALAIELILRGHRVEREVAFAASYRGVSLASAFRADLVIDGKVIVELKALKELQPIHFSQARTYLRFSGCPSVLLMNFHAPRMIDGFYPFHSDPLFTLPAAPQAGAETTGGNAHTVPESFGKG